MNIALIGYGKMGKAIEKAAIEKNHKIVAIFDINNIEQLTKENLKNIDVAMEFTTPQAAYSNITKCLDADIPVVSGTTGWLDKLPEIKQKVITENKTFFYAPNFSIGVNILFKVNEYLAKLMNKFNNYEVSIRETHHIHKLDAPSGTAIKLAEGIIKNIDRKKQWSLETQNPETLKIDAIRKDEIPGIHEIIYQSENDLILLKHSLKNRKALAQGAILAAEFIIGKKGFFTFENLLQ